MSNGGKYGLFVHYLFCGSISSNLLAHRQGVLMIEREFRGRTRLVERLRDRVRFAGRDVRCPCCEGRFSSFKLTPAGPLELECPRCGSRPRQRLLWLYLSAERLLATRGLRILHLAPERCIERRLRTLESAEYVTVGIENPLADVRADCTALPFEDGSFDRILCSYVLEGAPDDGQAMAELRRVLSPEGLAVVQAPVNQELERTVEAGGLRAYGRDFADRLRRAGFRVHVARFADEMDAMAAARHGVVAQYGALRNDLYLCQVPR
jgi:SAM-dependent methyltransferase